MAAKLLNNFKESSYALTQIELSYLDSQQPGSSPMTLKIACALAEKHFKKHAEKEAEEPIPTYFTNLWLKLLLANKEFDKALEYVEVNSRFSLWLDQLTWRLKIYMEMGDETKMLELLREMIEQNYKMEGDEF